jgi:hypothetical protein
VGCAGYRHRCLAAVDATATCISARQARLRRNSGHLLHPRMTIPAEPRLSRGGSAYPPQPSTTRSLAVADAPPAVEPSRHLLHAYSQQRGATSRSSVRVRQTLTCVREGFAVWPILAYPRYARHGFPLAMRELPSPREGSRMGAPIALVGRLMPSAVDASHDRRGLFHSCVRLYR